MKYIEMSPYVRSATEAQMELDGLIVLANGNGGKASMKKLPCGKIEYSLGGDPENVVEWDLPDTATSPWYSKQLEAGIVEASQEYEKRANSTHVNNGNGTIEAGAEIGAIHPIYIEVHPGELSLGVAEVVGGQ